MLTSEFVSAIADQMCARCFGSVDPEVCRGASTLADLPKGCRGTVLGFSDELSPHIARRLFDLGFAPGVEAEFVRKAPMRDPLMFRVADTEVVLRKKEARHVLIGSVQ